MKIVEQEGLVSKYRLKRFTRAAIANRGNISADAVNVLAAACSDFANKAAQSAWVYATQENKRTILERHAIKGIEAARHLFAPEVVEGLSLRLRKITEEVEGNDECRRKMFEADGRGRKAADSQNGKLET